MKMPDFKWILKESKLPWLKLDIKFPYEKMLDEAKSCKNFFVKQIRKLGPKYITRIDTFDHYNNSFLNKILTLENINQKEEPVRFISNVALEKAFDLFLALNASQLEKVTSLPWEKQ